MSKPVIRHLCEICHIMQHDCMILFMNNVMILLCFQGLCNRPHLCAVYGLLSEQCTQKPPLQGQLLKLLSAHLYMLIMLIADFLLTICFYLRCMHHQEAASVTVAIWRPGRQAPVAPNMTPAPP